MPYKKTMQISEEIKTLSYDEKINLINGLISDIQMSKTNDEQGHNKETAFIKCLELFKELLYTSEEIKMYDYIINHFNLLSEDKQKTIFRRTYVSVRDSFDRKIQDENEKYCKEHGHDFTDWEYIEGLHSHIKSTYPNIEDSNGLKEYLSCWMRTCQKCGYKEVSYNNPHQKKLLQVFKRK